MALPTLNPLDTSLNVYTDEWADIRLKGQIDRARYVEGSAGQVIVPVADLYRKHDLKTSIEAQLLFGQTLKIFDDSEDRLLVQADNHGYVGWLDRSAVRETIVAPTHRVIVPRSFLYPGPDMKFTSNAVLSMGSLLCVVGSDTTRGTDYAILDDGRAIVSDHAAPLATHFQDYVAVAETLMHTPYLWGGDSAFGLDCSGLVQLCMAITGRQVLRDSYMQAATLGNEFDPAEDFANLERGDLVFWKGHVGIVQGDGNLIHSNGHSMMVSSENLIDAINRIAYLYERPIGFRRP